MTGDGKSLDRDGWCFQLAPATGCRAAELVERALAAASGKAGRLLRRSRNASSFRSTTGTGQVSAEVFIKVIEPPHGIDRLKAILRGSRVAHVARITEKLNTAGFAAPPVLLFGREEATGRELLLTPVVNDDGPFRALEGTLAQKRTMLRALGTELARLHRAGFIHGDLTPYNLFIARAPRFTFIDHERTRRTFPIGRRRRQLRNLVQLGRFDLPSLSRTDRMRVLRAYGADLDRPAWRSLRRRVTAMLQRRIKRDGLEPARRA
jgi:Lipopolysaccharide kinase (Kdo/WaaP) family